MRESIRKSRAHGERDVEPLGRHDRSGRGHAHSGRAADASRQPWPRNTREAEEMFDAEDLRRAHARSEAAGGRG